MNKPTQYILCGLPFSGKTTLGKVLEERLGFVHVNLDQIRSEKGYGEIPEDDIPDSQWEEIFKEADRLLIRALKEGKSVANETAWVTRKWRDRARSVAKEEGFSTKTIYLNIPESVARERWRKNKIKFKRYNTPDNEFEEYVRDFEEPTEDENVIIYDQSVPIGEWIANKFHK